MDDAWEWTSGEHRRHTRAYLKLIAMFTSLGLRKEIVSYVSKTSASTAYRPTDIVMMLSIQRRIYAPRWSPETGQLYIPPSIVSVGRIYVHKPALETDCYVYQHRTSKGYHIVCFWINMRVQYSKWSIHFIRGLPATWHPKATSSWPFSISECDSLACYIESS